LSFVCLFVAGVLRATLPTRDFTVAWTHSVEKTRWEERYRVERGQLRLREARIQGSGAGMDPPPGARLRDGWWSWRPQTPRLGELRLTLSPFTTDYDLCWAERCRTLRDLTANRDAIAIVEIRPCAGKEQSWISK
jgi:hypothetical protein